MPAVVKQTLKEPNPTGSVLERIKPIGFGREDGLKFLIYGETGSGKTTFWATFPGPILAIVCSAVKNPGELRSVDTAEYRDKICQVDLQCTDELATVLKYASTNPFKTVVLDHATGLQDLALKEVLGLDEIPVQKSWGMATLKQYGQTSIMCMTLLRSLLSLSQNIVIVAQERVMGPMDSGDESTNDIIVPTVGPALMKAIRLWLVPACDYVVQSYKKPKMSQIKTKIAGNEIVTQRRDKGVDYCLRTEPHDIYVTKFRIPKEYELPECIVNPTYEKVMKLIRGN